MAGDLPLHATQLNTETLESAKPRLTADAVRAARLRLLIGRSVAAGLNRDLAHNDTLALPLMHPCRGSADIAFARQVAMYLAHVGCGLTFAQTAQLYGRDRTTAARGCRLVEERRDDPGFDRILDLLERCVRLGVGQMEPRQRVRAGLRAALRVSPG